MAFSKSFPRTTEKSVYPKWEEIFLSDAEEEEVEEKARTENNALMKGCMEDAKKLVSEMGLKPFQTNIVQIGIALFEKRASHTIYWKESRAKEKFDSL